MTKSFKNGKTLISNNNILSDEPPSNNPICSKLIEELSCLNFERKIKVSMQLK